MKKLLMLALLLANASAYAGFSTTYRGVADCGNAEGWPRENWTTPSYTRCNISLRMAADGRDRSGDIVGDMDFTVGDMRFSGTFIQQGSQIYLDFHGKKYRHYRGATMYRGGQVGITIGGRRVILSR